MRDKQLKKILKKDFENNNDCPVKLSDVLPEENFKNLNDNLYNKYKKFYGLSDNNIRLYSRDYNTSVAYSKLYGNIYSIIDFYAIIRIPDELFNVKNIIYDTNHSNKLSTILWGFTSKDTLDIINRFV